MSKKALKQAARSGGSKRQKRAVDADEFILADDVDIPEDEDALDPETQETAAEKRLRLAKAYLDQLQDVVEDEEDAGDAIAARLAQEAAESSGRLQRRLAARVTVPSSGQRFARGRQLSLTALSLTQDDRTAFTVSKDGSIFKWDVETMTKTVLKLPDQLPKRSGGSKGGSTAPWIKKGPRQGSRAALYACAVSSDGMLLAVGGGDTKIHVLDARTGEFAVHFPGHRDVISGLAFREGTHELLSCSFDRAVKLWSLDDRAYMDTLFGHQAPILSIDVLRHERAVTSAIDRTCRVWKIPEQSQLIFREHLVSGMSIECCRYITGTEWVSGASDGSLQVWSQMRKKPICLVNHAHGKPGMENTGSKGHLLSVEDQDTRMDGNGAASAGPEHRSANGDDVAMADDASHERDMARGAGVSAVLPDAAGWVQSVAICPGSDLVASGAGDSFIKLWQVQPNPSGGARGLKWLHSIPAAGFVNGLAVARSARFVMAAIGQEPRMGRWLRHAHARNGLLLQPLDLSDE